MRVPLACRKPLVYFRNRCLDLLFTDRMRGRGGLTLELCLGQPQRFELSHLVGIDGRTCCAAPLPFRLTFLDPFLNSRIRVDESLSRITHTFKPTIIVCRAQTF